MRPVSILQYSYTRGPGIPLIGFKGVRSKQCIAPLPKALVNKDNISIPLKVLFRSFRISDDEENPYNNLHQENGRMHSVMHDGIQKF